MAGRPPGRGGQCAAGPSRATRNPGLTRAAQLRQAKSAAFVKEQLAKEEALAAREPAACELPRKARVPRFTKGPPPAEPRRIQMTKPTMTKAMMARMKHAEEFTRNLEKQRQPATFQKKPVGRQAPVGGDARMGYGTRRRPPAAPPCAERREEDWQPQGALQEAAASSPAGRRLQKMREQRMPPGRGQKNGPCAQAGPSSAPGACPKGPPRRGMPLPQASSTIRRNRPVSEEQSISEKTCQLAQSMNAEVLQAEPVGEGPVQNIVIPPGAVSECRTTIVSLPSQQGNNSSVGNSSILIIADSLDEQDALESLAVNSRLSELQHARRDFVLAIASVGNNVINLSDNPPASRTQERGLYELPDPEHDMFRVQYGRNHPTINAAREFAKRSRATMQDRENQMRIDREFARAARQEGGLRLDVPIEQEIMEGDISFEEDESGMIIPCASRIKASMPPIPRKHVAAVTEAIGPEELERFFNPGKYPMPCDGNDYAGPPPGRENLHPDLWELDDPWYNECSQPDLIDFNDY